LGSSQARLPAARAGTARRVSSIGHSLSHDATHQTCLP
jgi:hypothetical protein